MAKSDLSHLYSVKKALESYYAVERQNQAVYDKQSSEIYPVRKAADKRVESLEKKQARCKANNYFARKGFWILLVGFLLIATLFVGSRTFLSSYVSPDLSLVADRYADRYLTDEGGYAALEDREDRVQAANEAATLCFGNLILITLVTGFVFLIGYFMQFGENEKEEGGGPLFGYFLLFALASVCVGFALPALSRTVWGLDPTVGTLSLFFGALVASVAGIGEIFTVTYSFALFVLLLDVFFYGTITLFYLKREKYVFKADANKRATKIKAQIAAVRKEMEDKCAAIYQKYLPKFKPNPYDAAYNRLPAYQRDYGTVTALIWAIENGYASDIVSARNYWDRKAHDASVQRQLQQIHATSEAALRTSEAALRAAEAPVDVNVTIYS